VLRQRTGLLCTPRGRGRVAGESCSLPVPSSKKSPEVVVGQAQAELVPTLVPCSLFGEQAAELWLTSLPQRQSHFGHSAWHIPGDELLNEWLNSWRRSRTLGQAGSRGEKVRGWFIHPIFYLFRMGAWKSPEAQREGIDPRTMKARGNAICNSPDAPPSRPQNAEGQKGGLHLNI
jgi:hypothetical protein